MDEISRHYHDTQFFPKIKFILCKKKGSYELPPYHPNCRGTVVPVWGEKGPTKAQTMLHELEEFVKEKIEYTITKHYDDPIKHLLETLSTINRHLPKGHGSKTNFSDQVYQYKTNIIKEVIDNINNKTMPGRYKRYFDPQHPKTPTVEIRIGKHSRRYHIPKNIPFVPKGKLPISPRRKKSQ